MKFKLITVLLIFGTSCVYGQIGYYDYYNYKRIDRDKDFKVELSEVRDWSEAFARVYTHSEEMVSAFPLAKQLMDDADKDADRTISKKELRDFQKVIYPIFKTAYEDFKLNYDTNKNRRIDKSEVAQAFAKYSDYLTYFNANAHKFYKGDIDDGDDDFVAADEPEEEQAFEERRPAASGKKLDDIYD
ncbi:MAG: hypothetical protein NE330_06060 [Lentisphaeraceae bacterium]|nr:hypothetical protein [Lentisphaeraceae bacterium]